MTETEPEIETADDGAEAKSKAEKTESDDPDTAEAVAGAEVVHCPACGAELVSASARFCEDCGAEVGSDGQLVTVSSASGDDTADTSVVPCARCGEAVGEDGYCTVCGHEALEPVEVDDRGPVAAATHRGKRHHRNEDSYALAATAEGWPVLVVSDGVSVSPNPHLASRAAVDAAVEQLADRPFPGPDAIVAAVAAAHEAACAVPNDTDPHWTTDSSHPACTIVVAVVAGDTVHVGNIGDARAHLLRPEGDGWAALQISTDDSAAAEAAAAGVDLAVALSLPGGHAITAWLGADAPDPAVHLRSEPAAPDDQVLVTSDGLWNYAPTDAALGGLFGSVFPLAPPDPGPDPALGLDSRPDPSPAQVCEQLVTWANAQGGADNITVALAPVASADRPDQTPEPAGGTTDGEEEEL